jgi:hypothetical protein
MATETVHNLAELVSPAGNDEIGIWDVSAGQYMRISRTNLVGGTITGGGTIVTGGNTLTLGATGQAALLNITQEFTARQTFHQGVISPVIRPIADSPVAVSIQNAAGGAAVLTVSTVNGAHRVFVSSLAIGVETNWLTRPSAGVLRQSLETVSLLENTTLQISSRARGFFYIENHTIQMSALYVVDNAVTLLYGNSTYWGTAVDTASKINLYASGGAVYVQNRRISSNIISVWGIS